MILKRALFYETSAKVVVHFFLTQMRLQVQFRKDRWFCPFDALSWANTSNSALHLLYDRLISLMILDVCPS